MHFLLFYVCKVSFLCKVFYVKFLFYIKFVWALGIRVWAFTGGFIRVCDGYKEFVLRACMYVNVCIYLTLYIKTTSNNINNCMCIYISRYVLHTCVYAYSTLLIMSLLLVKYTWAVSYCVPSYKYIFQLYRG